MRIVDLHVMKTTLLSVFIYKDYNIVFIYEDIMLSVFIKTITLSLLVYISAYYVVRRFLSQTIPTGMVSIKINISLTRLHS